MAYRTLVINEKKSKYLQSIRISLTFTMFESRDLQHRALESQDFPNVLDPMIDVHEIKLINLGGEGHEQTKVISAIRGNPHSFPISPSFPPAA